MRECWRVAAMQNTDSRSIQSLEFFSCTFLRIKASVPMAREVGCVFEVLPFASSSSTSSMWRVACNRLCKSAFVCCPQSCICGNFRERERERNRRGNNDNRHFEHVITYCFNWESFLCQRRPRRAMPCTTIVQHIVIDSILLSPDFRTPPPILIPPAAAASVLHNGLLCCCIFIFHVGFAVHLM